MRIVLATPGMPRTASGNGTTAGRWARILRGLGHRVVVATDYDGRPADALIALHARKSARAARDFHRRHPRRAIIAGLAGTDLYRDLGRSAAARRTLEIASHIVLLQPKGIDELPPNLHERVRVIYQSARRPARRAAPLRSAFEVLVVANLRAVKDPLRAALASRRLPADSRIRVTHVGQSLSPALERRARLEAERNRRFRWLGPRPFATVQRLMTRARVLCLTSRAEGGANVVSEALAAGTPILGSAIPGTLGILGDDYPGYFPTGDTAALCALLRRFEKDAPFRRAVTERCRALASLVAPAAEKQGWQALLDEVEALSS